MLWRIIIQNNIFKELKMKTKLKADIQMLLRQCRLHNVPIACNRISADLMISSRLWDDPTYKPIEQSYIRFDRN